MSYRLVQWALLFAGRPELHIVDMDVKLGILILFIAACSLQQSLHLLKIHHQNDVVRKSDCNPSTSFNMRGLCEACLLSSERFAAAGRDFSRFTMNLFRCPPELDALHHVAAAGADRALLILPPVAEPEALETVSAWAEQLLPAFGSSAAPAVE